MFSPYSRRVFVQSGIRVVARACSRWKNEHKKRTHNNIEWVEVLKNYRYCCLLQHDEWEKLNWLTSGMSHSHFRGWSMASYGAVENTTVCLCVLWPPFQVLRSASPVACCCCWYELIHSVNGCQMFFAFCLRCRLIKKTGPMRLELHKYILRWRAVAGWPQPCRYRNAGISLAAEHWWLQICSHWRWTHPVWCDWAIYTLHQQ